jgi:hypothetical protein
MPKEISDIQGLVEDIVQARQATAKARFLPRGDSEPPRKLLERACEPLELALATHGFRFSRSRLEFKRKSDGISQVVKLKGNSENLAGHRASCIVDVSVMSKDYAEWLKRQGFDDSEYLWTNQLGYMASGRDYLRWDFAAPATRDAEVADIKTRILDIALPALDAWSSKAAIARAVETTQEVKRLDWLVQIALWAGGAGAGRVALRRGEFKFASDPEDLARLVREFDLDPRHGIK